MNSADLQNYIDTHTIEAVILPMAEHTPTVPDAAKALQVETDQIIKSLVFMVKNEPLLVISNGEARVDRRKIAEHLGVGRGRIKFASVNRALEITGFIVGSMPPFGHKTKLRTLVDAAIPALPEIFGGGGAIDAMMRLTPSELMRVTTAEVLPLSE
jgi:prolyl-tRNA editing enzyme YbaK/EbsC (Cys-tRNA(Pro) deacylase)